jgi:hypothetical protein
VDLDRLSLGERIAGGAAALLLVTSFIPLWAKYEVGNDLGFGGANRFSAWSEAFNFLMKLALILVIAVLAYVIARAAGVDLSAVPPIALLAVAGVSFLLILLELLIGPQEFGLSGVGVEVSRGPLLFLGALLGAAMAGGAYLAMQAEGTRPVGGTASAPPPA